MSPPQPGSQITKKARKSTNDDSITLENYTRAQLRQLYNGEKEAKHDDLKPLYISLNGTVFDVSQKRNVYGPGGVFELYAGRECGVALARMSTDESLLDDVEGCDSKLNDGEKMVLNKHLDKFRENPKEYPVVGRLVPDDKIPASDRVISKEELAKYDGVTVTAPEGYAANPIYIGLGKKVYDVSFGGVEFYGEGCGYNMFAGRDVSRALAKMSFEKSDLDSSDITDLTEAQIKVLNDWIKKYEEMKMYPCVGSLQK
mmetsp:Transcript_28644/g.34890  ORF Transcript_28644/g.34890 Transcript_28644/m.34890 type:complete len:257 (-) Transcript_28644:120-890(-)|eukprot:CAMPEP_0172498430 /NCGR_PEP_ID=MMETSP1066-20121228/113429_1 /TAXON_ID=671091 /ORGANISM="Coscinodiscus wailesii, Strain CCMP2513" /LENGTH=256 /DNA_ID=CAMNT_0013271707 /DNA_START=37 /DNA_END=807 /DNA_ORIENTATION=+